LRVTVASVPSTTSRPGPKRGAFETGEIMATNPNHRV
jgi:hypothetical protein